MTDNPSPAAYVKLTQPAADDLARLAKHAPLALKWALKKMLLLERDPLAGEPLLGGLVGFRKLVVSDRNWRIVWRPTEDDSGEPVVEIAEVWAVGARSDDEVYAEMSSRVSAMPQNPQTIALAEVIEQIGRLAGGVTAARPPAHKDPVPAWMLDRLIHTVGLDRETAETMTMEEAVDAWTAWQTSKRD